MKRILEGLRSPLHPIVQLTLAFLEQMATRPEGRQGMITAGIFTLVSDLCMGGFRLSGNSFRCILGLLACCFLARQNVYPTIAPDVIVLDRTPKESLNALYENLCELLSKPNDAAEAASLVLLQGNVIPFLIEFLVHEKGDDSKSSTQKRMQRHV